MPANTNPIFGLTPNIGRAAISVKNTATDGTGTLGTNMYNIFVAGSNGSFVEKVRFLPISFTGSSNFQSGVFSVYYSTVNTGTTTNADTYLLEQIQVAQVFGGHSSNTFYNDIYLSIAIPANTFLHASINQPASAINLGFSVIAYGVNY